MAAAAGLVGARLVLGSTASKAIIEPNSARGLLGMGGPATKGMTSSINLSKNMNSANFQKYRDKYDLIKGKYDEYEEIADRFEDEEDGFPIFQDTTDMLNDDETSSESSIDNFADQNNKQVLYDIDWDRTDESGFFDTFEGHEFRNDYINVYDGGESMEIGKRIFHVDENENLEPIQILYIPTVDEILNDNPIINVFSDDTLEGGFYDLFQDKKKAHMLLQAHKRILNNLTNIQNKTYSVKHKILILDGDYKILTNEDTNEEDDEAEEGVTSAKSLKDTLESIRNYGWDDYIKSLNTLFIPYEFSSTKRLRYISEDVNIVMNDKNDFIFYGSLFHTKVPTEREQFILKTDPDESLIGKLIHYEKKMIDEEELLNRKPDTNDIDDMISFYLKAGLQFDDLNKDFINSTFAREDEQTYKSQKLAIIPPNIPKDYLNFFNHVHMPTIDPETLKEQIKRLQQDMEHGSNSDIDINDMILKLHSKDVSIDDIRKNLRDKFREYNIAEAIRFLKLCLDSQKTKQETIDMYKERMDKIRYDYVVENIYQSSKLKNEIKEIIESNDNDTGRQFIKKELHFEENMDFETYANSVDNSYFDIEPFINEYSCYKDYSDALRDVIPSLLQLQGVMNLPIDIGMILSIITKPYLDNLESKTINKTDIFNYAVAATYMMIEENIVNGTFKEPQWLNDTCIAEWSIGDKPTEISEDMISPNGVLNYIVCCVVEISDFVVSDDLIDSIADIILKSFGSWYADIVKRYENIDMKKSKKGEAFNKAIENFIGNQDSSNYVKALLYMPNSKSQKQLNKRVMGCCPQRLSNNFKAFSDLVETDTKLKYLKDFINKKSKKDIDVWKAKPFYAHEDNAERSKNRSFVPEYLYTDIKMSRDINEILKMNEDILDQDLLSIYLENRHGNKMNTYIDNALKNFEKSINKKNKLFREFFTKDIKIRTLINMIVEIDVNHSMNDVIKRMISILDEIENQCHNSLEMQDQIKTVRLMIGIQFLSEKPLHVLQAIDGSTDQKLLKMFERYMTDRRVRLASVLFNRIVTYEKNMRMPTEQEYKAYAAKMREEYKNAALNILDSMNKDDRKLMVDLKKWGIYNYMNDLNSQKSANDIDIEYENEFKYDGEDNNFTEL